MQVNTISNLLIFKIDMSDQTGKKTPTFHVGINVNTSQKIAMEFAPQQTRAQNIVEMTPAFRRVLAMRETIESVETAAFMSQSSVMSIQTRALQSTFLVARRIMQDVLMKIREVNILSAATDVCGTVHGLYITTYLVGMNACTGRYGNCNIFLKLNSTLENMLKTFMNVMGNASQELIPAMANAAMVTFFAWVVASNPIKIILGNSYNLT